MIPKSSALAIERTIDDQHVLPMVAHPNLRQAPRAQTWRGCCGEVWRVVVKVRTARMVVVVRPTGRNQYMVQGSPDCQGYRQLVLPNNQ